MGDFRVSRGPTTVFLVIQMFCFTTQCNLPNQNRSKLTKLDLEWGEWEKGGGSSRRRGQGLVSGGAGWELRG